MEGQGCNNFSDGVTLVTITQKFPEGSEKHFGNRTPEDSGFEYANSASSIMRSAHDRSGASPQFPPCATTGFTAASGISNVPTFASPSSYTPVRSQYWPAGASNFAFNFRPMVFIAA